MRTTTVMMDIEPLRGSRSLSRKNDNFNYHLFYTSSDSLGEKMIAFILSFFPRKGPKHRTETKTKTKNKNHSLALEPKGF